MGEFHDGALARVPKLVTQDYRQHQEAWFCWRWPDFYGKLLASFIL